MSDIRTLLNKIEKINEAQNHEFLNAIVDKYAKQGMTLDDLSAMEQEASSTRPPQGFMSRLITRDFRIRYTLAHASKKLNLPGLYTSRGSFVYLDDEGEAASAGNANRREAQALADAGLLPPDKAERFGISTPASDDTGSTDNADTAASGGNTQGQGTAGGGGSSSRSGGLRLSDGSSFSRDPQSIRLLNQKAAQMVRRFNELVRKMNESAPVSLRGYLKEYNLQSILLEALTPEEERELQQIYQDLSTIVDYTDDQGTLISTANARLLRQKLDSAPDVAKGTGGTGGDQQAADAGDNAEPQGDAEQPQGDAEAPPEAQQASNASGDQDARVEPGEAPASSSLEAFARSGKGGLANDPDEVDAITELQQFLTDLGFDPRGVDGKYGGGTIAAVKEFQKFMGAKEDGDAGPETIGKIVQLRSIRWGEGGSKNFAEFRRALTRAEELISKAGSGAAQQATPQTQSIDFRHLISIVEGKLLNEALSDQEKEELQALLTQLDALANDAEWSTILPQPTQQRLAKIVRDGKAAVPASAEEPAASGDSADDVEADDAEDPEEPEDTRSAAAQQADPDGDGNADDPEAQVFAGEPRQAQGAGGGQAFDARTIANNIRNAIRGPGTDEEAVYAAIDAVGNAENWNSIITTYPQVYVDIYGDFGGSDLEQVRSKLRNIGVTMPPNPEDAQAQADAAADAAGAAARGEQPQAGTEPAAGGTTPAATNAQPQGGANVANMPDPTDEASATNIVTQAARDEALIAKLPPEDQALVRRLLQTTGQGGGAGNAR